MSLKPPAALDLDERNRFAVLDANLVYMQWVNNKVLQYSIGNYIQYPVINHNGK